MRSVAGVALIVGLGGAMDGQALAQGFPDLGYMGTTIGAGGLQTSAMNSVIAQSVESFEAGDATRFAPSQTLSVTAYRADPQVTLRVRKQFADWMGAQAGPEGRRQVAAAMERTDPVQNWARLVASDGLRPGDTADALTAYWVMNWMIANGGDNTRTQTQAVRNQVRPVIATNPAYARLDEAQRQEFAEILMLNFLIQHAAYVEAMQRGDQAVLQKLADAAVARFRNEMGVDLRQLQLTDRGLIRR
jgi:hypothetical protein